MILDYTFSEFAVLQRYHSFGYGQSYGNGFMPVIVDIINLNSKITREVSLNSKITREVSLNSLITREVTLNSKI